mmetsp:Transcript_37497/g.90914  ORF Transcript_37497/g.90914 Transcript_37497/m.90914 type:complete len:214 (+) Transcript_37497:922-1563(+)
MVSQSSFPATVIPPCNLQWTTTRKPKNYQNDLRRPLWRILILWKRRRMSRRRKQQQQLQRMEMQVPKPMEIPIKMVNQTRSPKSRKRRTKPQHRLWRRNQSMSAQQMQSRPFQRKKSVLQKVPRSRCVVATLLRWKITSMRGRPRLPVPNQRRANPKRRRHCPRTTRQIKGQQRHSTELFDSVSSVATQMACERFCRISRTTTLLLTPMSWRR